MSMKDDVLKRAVISECTHYRYTLHRCWDESHYPLVFCMLNPSKADASKDDPTIRRCMGFARSNGYGGIVVINLFAFRATKPTDIPADLQEAVGPGNADHIKDVIKGHDVVVAWGAN